MLRKATRSPWSCSPMWPTAAFPYSGQALNLLFAAHNLERVGDRITNIGERVIYAATGRLEELNIERPAT